MSCMFLIGMGDIEELIDKVNELMYVSCRDGRHRGTLGQSE